MIDQTKILATPTVSGVFPVEIQKAAIATVADSAILNPVTKEPVLAGAGIVTVNKQKTAFIGTYAATPKQLSGIALKPGMEKAVQRNIDSGMSIEKAIPSSAWKNGDISSFVKNDQTSTQSKLLDNGAKKLEAVVPGAIKNPIESVGLSTAISQVGTSTGALKANPASLAKTVLPSGTSAKSLISSLEKNQLSAMGVTGANFSSAVSSFKSTLGFGLNSPQQLSATAPTPSQSTSLSNALGSLKSKASSAISGAKSAVNIKVTSIMDSAKSLGSSISSKLSSGFSKASSNNLAEMTGEIKDKTASISAGGDYRVPRL